MTAVSPRHTRLIVRIMVSALFAVHCVPASWADSGDHQGTRIGDHVDRLAFTGTFRFRPASVRVKSIQSTASGVSSDRATLPGPTLTRPNTPPFAATVKGQPIENPLARAIPAPPPVPGRQVPVRRETTTPGPSKTDIARRPTPSLSHATRSSLGAQPGRNVTSPRSAARSKPPLPARYRRRTVRKNTRKVRSVVRAVKRAVKPPVRKPVAPPSSPIFGEAPPWANEALFKTN